MPSIFLYRREGVVVFDSGNHSLYQSVKSIFIFAVGVLRMVVVKYGQVFAIVFGIQRLRLFLGLFLSSLYGFLSSNTRIKKIVVA